MGATLADDTETTADLLAAACRVLAASGSLGEVDARREAEALIAAALQSGRAVLLAHPERRIGGDTLARVRDWLARRAHGEPLAYITGVREFWSLAFHVTPDVLVPRPETELVVSSALALGDACHARTGGHPALVDLGTGSGCIALAIAHERGAWPVTATDASPAALEIARGNARALELSKVEFLAGRWFEPLAGRRFDLIVSNPPYVAAGDAALDDPALRHEPRMALTPGGDGFGALRHLVDESPRFLVPSGWLVLEHGADQGPDLAGMLVARGFRHVRCAPDLAGHDRVTCAQWPHSTAGLP
jgi:release factor glutamine methyltransferase